MLRLEHRRPAGRVHLFAGGFAIITLSALVLIYFPPELYSFYPVCPIWSLFHIQCPGCGTTRAFAALLHGHFAQAMRLNPLTVCALPIVTVWNGYRSARVRLGYSVASETIGLPWLYVSSAALVAFTLLRNL